jgi:hypothetical protein
MGSIMPIKHAPDFNRDVVPTVVCVNKSTLDLEVDFDRLVRALQRFLDEVFVPVWGTPAKLVKSKDPKPGCWHLVFLDDADQKGTSSFHDITYSGMPIAKVFVRPAKKSGEVISVTACHELLEMLVDPSAALWTDGPRGTVWAYEVCDVVEDDKIDFNGIPMSDFVYPAYFDMFRLKKGAKSAQYDYLKKVKRPFQILDGGYSDIHKKRGGVTTKWGSPEKKKHFQEEDRRYHRSQFRRKRHKSRGRQKSRRNET